MTSTEKIVAVLREEEASLLKSLPADVQAALDNVSKLRKQWETARKAVKQHKAVANELARVRKSIALYTASPKKKAGTDAVPAEPAPAASETAQKGKKASAAK